MKEEFKKWCEEFIKGNKIPMEKIQSQIFYMMTIGEMQNKIPKEIDVNDSETPFPLKIIITRSRFINLQISIFTQIFLSTLCKSPGIIIMYLYFLKYQQLKDGKSITMIRLTDLFPLGFLDESSLKKSWESQKIGSSNLLDRDDLWE